MNLFFFTVNMQIIVLEHRSKLVYILYELNVGLFFYYKHVAMVIIFVISNYYRIHCI